MTVWFCCFLCAICSTLLLPCRLLLLHVHTLQVACASHSFSLTASRSFHAFCSLFGLRAIMICFAAFHEHSFITSS